MQISSSPSTHLILGLLLSSAACLVEAINEYVPFCLDPMCDPGQSEFMVRVQNDYAYWENEWFLEKLVKRRDPVEWEVVATKDLDYDWGFFEDTLCLEPESVYRWTITDSWGDGFNYCGSFQLVINRSQELIFDHGEPFSEETIAFLTPSDPRGDSAVVIDRTASPTGDPTESPTKSVSPTGSPSGSPTNSCTEDESELFVSVKTSYLDAENEWVLEKEDGNQVWVEAGSNSMPGIDTLYEDFFCLEPDSRYRWTITDPTGNGIVNYVVFSLTVNEEVILEDGRYDWWFERSVIFVTPSDPTGPVLVSTPVPSSSPSESPSRSQAPTTDAPSAGPSASLEPTAPPSLSPPPSLRPSANACDGEDEDLLTVEVQTDGYYFQSSWVLETRDEVGSTDWTEVASNDLPRSYTVYSDRVCLEAGRSYRWTFTDTAGNGFINNNAYYRVNLNGEEIVSPGDFECKVIKDIGPVECVDEPREHRVTNENGYGDLKYSCRQFENRLKFYGRGGLRTLCNCSLTDGSGFLYDKCKVLCASKGLGPCADDDALE